MSDQTPAQTTPAASRRSDAIADQLLEAILSGRLRPGDSLPSQMALAEHFGVSRTVVREAVRSLVGKGALSEGANRGFEIARPDTGPVVEAMSLLLRGSPGLSFGDAHEVREMLEAEMAANAAEHADDEDVAELRSLSERLAAAHDDVALASDLDVEFHRVIARATKNELYLVLLDSIGGVLLTIRQATLVAPPRRRAVLDEHAAVVEAIARRDPAAARAAMRDHLERVRRAWQEVTP